MSEDLYRAVEDSYPNLESRTVTLRGRGEPVRVRVISHEARGS